MKKLFILMIFSLCFISSKGQQIYHDAAIYDLKGNVKSCTDSTFKYILNTCLKSEITHNFAKEGNEEGEIKYIYKTIERDENGYIIKAITHTGRSMLYRYKQLDEEWLLDVSGDGEYTYATRYVRNEKGEVIQKQDVDSGEIEENYSNYKYDSYGNWIYRVANHGNEFWYIEHRTITYWDDKTVLEPFKRIAENYKKKEAQAKKLREATLNRKAKK